MNQESASFVSRHAVRSSKKLFIATLLTMTSVALISQVFTQQQIQELRRNAFEQQSSSKVGEGAISLSSLDPKLKEQIEIATKTVGAFPVAQSGGQNPSCTQGQVLSFSDGKLICVTLSLSDGSIDVIPVGAPTSDGAAGDAGSDGTDGVSGANGSDGASGSQGPAGPAGANGSDGAQGSPGVLSTSAGNGLIASVASQVLSLNIVTDSNGGIQNGTNGLGLIASCSSTQLLKWDGSAWVCGNDNVGTVATADLTSSTGGISITNGAGAVLGAGTSISIATASASQNGLLAGVDWTTFNNKENALTFNGNGLFSRTANTITANACATDEIMRYDGFAWVCSDSAGGAVGSAVAGGINTGIMFVDAAGNLANDVANFNYDQTTKKLTVTGGIDPLYLQIKDAGLGGGDAAYFEAYGGQNAAVSLANTGRLRYNSATNKFELSENGGVYGAISTTSLGSGQILVGNAGGTATATSLSGDATINNAAVLTIASNAITSGKIADGAVMLDKLADDSVTLSKLADSSVSSNEIVDGTIATTDLATGAVTTTIIADGAVTSVKVVDGGITLSKVAADAINGAKIIDGSVDTADLADVSVTDVKLAVNSVTSSKIVDGTIASADLADGLILTAKLADGSVSTAKLADDAVTTVKIADANITTAKLADGSVTLAKLANCSADNKTLAYYSVDPDGVGVIAVGWNCVDPLSEQDGVIGNEVIDATSAGGLERSGAGTTVSPYTLGISANGVITSMINADAVTTAKILDGTIGASDLADLAITTLKLADNSVSTAKLADGSVTTVKLADDSVSTVKLVDGSVTTVKLAADSVTSAKILDGDIVNADINAGAAIALSKLADGSNIITSLGAPSGSNANGGSITSNVLTLSLADATNPGLVSIGAQTFAGNKTFTGDLVQTGTAITSTGTGAVSLNGDTTIASGKNLIVQDGSVELNMSANSGDVLKITADSLIAGSGLSVTTASNIFSTILADFDITDSGSTGHTVAIGNAGSGSALTLQATGTGLALNTVGGVAFQAGSDFSTTGTVDDANFGNTSLVRLTGASTQTITGISGGQDGKLLTIMNTAGQAATLVNQAAGSLPENRIITGTGSNLTLAADATALLQYDYTSSRWRIVGGSGSSSAGYSSVDITNKATGGTIGAAASTVDVATNFNIDQTTTGQTLTLPTPSNTTATKGKVITINNVGTANFIVSSVTIPAGSYASAFVWNGSSWQVVNAASNVAAEFGQNTSIVSGSTVSNTTYVDVPGSSFTLPSAGTWEVEYIAHHTNAAAGGTSQTKLVNNAGVDVPSTYGAAQNGSAGERTNTSGIARITTTGAETFKMQFASGGANTVTIYNNTTNNGQSIITWKKISGNTASIGQTVDYGVITPSGGGLGVGSTVTLTYGSGNIAVAGNQFTLKAGKTYSVRAALRFSGYTGNYVFYNIQTAGNTQVSNTAVQFRNTSSSYTESDQQEATAIITPTVDTQYKIVPTFVETGTVSINSGESFVTIQQLGSSNVIAGSPLIFNNLASAVANGSLDNTSFTQTWNWSTLSTGNGLISNANALTSGVLQQLATSSTAFTGQLLNVTSTGNAVTSTGSLVKLDIVGSANAAKGLSINNAGTGDGIYVSSTGSGLALNASGGVAFRKGTDYSTAGVTVDWNPGNTSLIRLTGATAQTIDSITGGIDGKILTIINAGSSSATLRNATSSTSAIAANRILTGTGADILLAPDASLSVVYDSGSSRWRVVGGTGGGSSYASVDIADKSTGGAIGTAVATVDVATNFNVNQATVGQTLTIPSPTNTTTTKGKIITVNNIGTANFTLAGITVPAGSYGSAFVWTGSVWNAINAASNVAAQFVTSNITSGQTTTSTAYVDVANGTLSIPTPGTYSVSYSVPFVSSAAGVPVSFQLTDSANAAIAGTTVTASAPVSGIRSGTANTGDINTSTACASTGAITSCSNTSGVGNNRYTINYADLGYAPIVIAQYRDSLNTGTLANDFFPMPVVGTPTNTSAQFLLEENGSNAQNVTINVQLINPSDTSLGQATLASVPVTFGAAGTYKLRYKTSNTNNTVTVYNNATEGTGYVSANLIAGNSPVTGQSVSYVMANQATNQNPAVGTVVNYSANVQGNITNLGSGRYRLEAGKTYKLQANWAPVDNTSDLAEYQFFNNASGSFVAFGQIGTGADPGSANSFGINAEAVITPTVTTDVEVRWLTDSATGSDTTKSSLYIVQLGSTAFTGISMSTLTSAIANNSLDNTSFAQTWNWSTATTQTGLTMNANALTSGTLQQLATSSTAFTGALLNLSSTGNAITSTGSLAKLDIVGSANAADGLTINNAGIGDGININSTGTGLGANIGGSVAFKSGSTYTTAGSANDVAFANGSYIRLDTAGAAQTITGIAGGVDGELLTLTNADAALAITFANESASSTAANRIVTGTGADLTVAAGASINMIYDSTSSRWRVVGGSGGAAGFSSLDIVNDADGGAIGTAVATVDTYTNFNINQTTASQTFTIPAPTNTTTTKGKIVTINNVGTANFAIGGVTVPAGSYGSAFVWNGTVWNPINAASNVAAGYYSVFDDTDTSGTSGDIPVAAGTVKSTGAVTLSANQFTVADAGTYRVAFNASTRNNSSFDSTIQARIVRNGSVIYTTDAPGLEIDGVGSKSAVPLNMEMVLDLNVGDTIKFTYTAGQSWLFTDKNVTFEKVSGNAAVTGQSVDYVEAILSANHTPVVGNTVPFVTSTGNIPNTSGVFTLTAGKTYELQAFPAPDNTGSSGEISFQWRDLTNNAFLGKQSRSFSMANPTNLHSSDYSARAVITPTTNVTVALRPVAVSGGVPLLLADGTSVSIKQLGSTAFTGVSMSALTGALAANALDNTNFTQTWNFSTLSTGNGLVSNANALTSGVLQQLATSSTAFTGALLNLSSTGNAITSTGSLAKLDIVGSANAADGLTINNAGTGDAINVASTGTGLAANFGGGVALRAGTTYTTAGSANNVSLGNSSFVRLDTAGAAQTLTGIVAGADGQLLTLTNADAALAVTLANESASSTAANRIVTGTSVDLNVAAGASVSLIYDVTSARWRVVGGTGSAGGYSSLTIVNDANGGNIGTASATVDQYTNFNMAQTTASQAFTIPAPTNTTTTAGKIITINNTGTANFAIGSVTIPAGSYGSAFVWNGTAWNPINAASNVATNYYSARGAIIDLDSPAPGTPVYVPLNALASVATGDYAGISAAEYDPNSLRTSADTLTIDQTGDYRISVNVQHVGANISGISGQNQLDGFLAGYSVNGTFIPIQGNDDANNLPQDINGSIITTLTSGSTLQFGLANNAASFNDEDFIVNFSINQVSGNAPVTGQVVDTLNATINNQTPPSNTQINVAGTLRSGNIGYTPATGAIAVHAGKTYNLRATIHAITNGDANGSLQYWFSTTSAGAVGTAINGVSVGAAPLTSGAPVFNAGLLDVTYTPVANETIYLVSSVNSGSSRQIQNGSLSVTQLGSSAFTGVSMSALTGALAANALDNTNFTQTWNFSTLSTGNGLVSNANALTSGVLQQLATSSTAFTGALLNLSSTGNAITSTGSLAKLDIVGSANAADGLTINNAGTGDAINVASTGTGLAANFGGGVALRAGTTYTTAGSANNVSLGNSSFVRLDTTGAAQTLTGIVAGADGQLLTLTNADAALAVTLANESASSTAANRIVTGTGVDLNVAAGASVSLIYDVTSSRWRVVGGTGGSSVSSVTLSNFASNLVVGTAAATVDVATNLIIPQTTTSISLTLPNPTVTTAGKTITVNNTGNAAFTMYDVQIPAIGSSIFVWNGTLWTGIEGYGNVAADYGEVVLPSNLGLTTNVLTTVVQTPVLSAGTWKLDAQVAVSTDTNSQTFAAGIYSSDNLTTNIAGAAQLVYAGGAFAGGSTSWSTFVTSDGTKSYLIRGRENNTNATVLGAQDIAAVNTGSVTKLVYTKVSGSAAVVGQSVDYHNITWSAGTTASPAIGAAYNLSVGTVRTQSGNIPFNGTSNWTLTAGKTYRLTASMAAGSVNGSQVAWYDDTTGLPISNSNASAQDNGTTNVTTSGSADVIITPTTNRTVSLRALSSQPLLLLRSSVTIVQLGSSAFTGVSMSALTGALAANTLDNTNFAQTWNWSTATTETGLTLTAGALTTGTIQDITTSSASLNSTNGLLRVANLGASASGIVFRAQANSTSGSGLTVNADGRVGVGIITPTGSTLQVNDSTGEGILVTSSNATEGGQVTFGGASGQAAFQIDNFNDASAQDFRVLEGNTTRAYLTLGTNGWITPSDARLKDNVMTLDNVLEKLEGVRGTSYKLKDSGALQIGVIAQEFKAAFPGVVSGDESTGLLGVSYDSVAAIAIQGVKELNMKVEANKVALDGKIVEGITGVSGKLAKLTDGLTSVTGDISAINTALDAVNQRLASIDGRIAALENAPAAIPAVTNQTTVVNNITKTQEDTKQVGTVTIKASKIGVNVRFTDAYASAPAIYITPLGGSVGYAISNVTTAGFTLMIDKPATNDQSFNWLSIEIGKADSDAHQIDAPATQVVPDKSTPAPKE